MTGLTKTMIMGLEIRGRFEMHLRQPCMGFGGRLQGVGLGRIPGFWLEAIMIWRAYCFPIKRRCDG